LAAFHGVLSGGFSGSLPHPHSYQLWSFQMAGLKLPNESLPAATGARTPALVEPGVLADGVISPSGEPPHAVRKMAAQVDVSKDANTLQLVVKFSKNIASSSFLSPVAC
jgi:hypothetical protein